MIALWIVLGISIFFFILLSFSFTIYIKITDEVELFVGAFGYKKNINLEKTNSDEEDKSKKKKKKKPSKIDDASNKVRGKKANEKSFSETLDFAVTLIRLIVPDSVRMAKRIRITGLKIFIAVACEDADKTAITYGGVSASVYTLLGVLDSTFKLKIKFVDIIPDFVSGEPKYDISFKVKLRFIHIHFGAIGIIFKIIVNTLKSNKNKEKVEIKPPINKKAV